MSAREKDDVRTLILSLLLSKPEPIPLAVLDQDYYQMEEKRIPFRKLGFNDLVSFLKSMPEYFAIEWHNGGYYVSGIATEKSKHVSSLVSRQKNTKRSNNPPHYRRPFVSRQVPLLQRQRVRIPAEQLSYIATYVRDNPQGVTIETVMTMVQQQLPHSTFTIHDIRNQLHELSHCLYLDGDRIYPTNPKNDEKSREVKNYPQSSMSQPQNVPQNVLRSEFVGGDEGSDLMGDFSDEDFNNSPNSYENNYSKQPKTSERIAANFAWNVNNKHNATTHNHNDEYFAARNKDSNATASSCYIDVTLLISERTKSRLDQLIRQHPEGIWCADLPEKYLEAYKVHLNYYEIGFTSVREYVSYLPNIFYMTRSKSNDDFILYSADKRPTVPDQEESLEIRSNSREQHDKHDTVRTQFGDKDAPIPADVSSSMTKLFAPDDVMNYNDSVEQILVTDLQRDRKYLEVYIVEIFHPTFFWIHLRENKKRFDVFMDELDKFYHNNKDKYIIPKIALKKGLNCACTYSGRWHRGIIRSVKPDFRVTVMFYDYGTLKTYAAEDIYYLNKQFSFLPAQAIPCGLYNVKPCVGDRWKKSVIEKLIDRINETLLALTIMSVDPANNSMMVILSDTSEEEDVHINDWLIKEKLARCGKMGDAVDMASIMRYVVNNMNQLPTYCYAEENLISDSHCKATSTEELHEKAPSISEQTHQSRDGLEQHSMRPPPGFAPLGEQKPSLSNMSARNFNDIYSFGSTLNTKTSSYADMTTNPFLDDQQFVNDNFIPNDVAKQIFVPLWNKNVHLFAKLIEILCDLLERSPLNKKIFENHMIIQHHLNRFLEKFVKALIPSDSDTSSSASLNLTREMTDKLGSMQNINSSNLNTEGFVNQKLAGNLNNLLLSNPFGDDRLPQAHSIFPTYGSNSYTLQSSWHQSDGFNPRIQVPSSPMTSSSATSLFNFGPTATPNIFFLNADQSNVENAPVTKPAYPVISMNADVSNNNRNSASFFNLASSEFANVSTFKETNPFRRSSMTADTMQIPQRSETQSEPMVNSYDMNSASYLSVKNLQDHAAKMEAANIHVGNSSFTATEHVNSINGAKGTTPRIIYEAGPVMYNTQKKQTDGDVKQNAYNNDFKNDRNVPLNGQCDNKELSANVITPSYSTNSLHIDEGYATRAPTDFTLQNLSQISKNESIYHQQSGNTNERIIFSQAWKQVEVPEHWIKSQMGNASSQNHIEKPTIDTSINFLSTNNNKESVTQDGMADLSYIFQQKDKENHMDLYNNFLNNLCYIENKKCIEYNSKNNFINISFVFQKIDSVKNVSFIFHTENEGWMLTSEFVNTFTNFEFCSHLTAMTEMMNIKVIFKEIKRTDYPLQFLELDHYPLNVSRDSNNRIISINLISLQGALLLLHKLKIVSREEIDNAFKKKEFVNGSILPDMWTLFSIYRDLKQRIEQYTQFR